jgi:hypothetical protein
MNQTWLVKNEDGLTAEALPPLCPFCGNKLVRWHVQCHDSDDWMYGWTCDCQYNHIGAPPNGEPGKAVICPDCGKESEDTENYDESGELHAWICDCKVKMQ